MRIEWTHTRPRAASLNLGRLWARAESDEAFLLGLRDVVAAHGGMGHLADATGLNRESLYRTLSTKGNPRLESLALILQAQGLQLSFAAASGDPRAA